MSSKGLLSLARDRRVPHVVIHPSIFREEQQLVPMAPGSTVREALEKANALLPGRHALVFLNDQRVTSDSVLLGAGDILIIRSVPSGGVGDAIGKAWNDAVHVMTNFVDGNFLQWLNPITYIFGAMTFLYSLGDSAVQSMLPKIPSLDTSQTPGSLSINGGRNSVKPYQPVPIILGRTLIAPPLGSKIYTSWDGANPANQILNQVFVVGLGRISVTNAKIGGKVLSDFGVAPTMQIQTMTNDSYGGIVTEAGVGIELKAGAPQIQVTVADIDAINLDFSFPSGLFAYNKDGDRVNTAVGVTIEYKKTTLAWGTGGSLAPVWVESFNRAVTKQVSITAQMLSAAGRGGYTGTWDVRVTRTTPDSTDTKVSNRSYWSVMRSFESREPMSTAVKGITTRIKLVIQATDQLNGAIDNFNVEAQSIVPRYLGAGSGPAAWGGATALQYPAVWKNVPMNTGGFSWPSWTGDASSNPAALYLWVLRGPINPKPLRDTEIDWPSFEAWYSFCAAKGLEVNVAWDQGGQVSDLLARIAAIGRASLAKLNNRISIIFDDVQTVPVQHFTPRNSWGFTTTKIIPDQVHAVRAQFIDPASGWKQAEQVVYLPGYTSATATEFRTVQLWGVTDYQQARKAILYSHAVETLRPEVHQLNVDFEHLACRRGSLVVLAHYVLLNGLTSARIVSVALNDQSQAVSVTVDEECVMEAGKLYALRWRRMDGTSVVSNLVTVIGATRTLIFTDPVLTPVLPEFDNLCTFGIQGLETTKALVSSIERTAELSARVTLVKYDPAVYTADTGVIPAWTSGITPPPKASYGTLPGLSVPSTTPPNPDAVIIPSPVFPVVGSMELYLAFDGNTIDQSPNGNNATVAGTVNYVSGNTGLAVATPGTAGNYIELVSPLPQGLQHSFTLAFRGGLLNSNATQLFTIFSSADTGFDIRISKVLNTSGTMWTLEWFTEMGDPQALSSWIVADLDQHEFAVVFDAVSSRLSFWVDRNLTASAVTSMYPELDTLWIGRSNNLDHYSVQIEDFRFDSRAWSEQEVNGWSTLRATWAPGAATASDIATLSPRYLGVAAADPSAANLADFYYNTTTKKMRKLAITGWQDDSSSASFMAAALDIISLENSNITQVQAIQFIQKLVVSDAFINNLATNIVKSTGLAKDAGGNVTAGMEIDLASVKIRAKLFRLLADGDFQLGPVGSPLLRFSPDGVLTIGSVTVNPQTQFDPTTLKGHLRPKSLYSTATPFTVTANPVTVTLFERGAFAVGNITTSSRFITRMTLELVNTAGTPIGVSSFVFAGRVFTDTTIRQVGTPATPIAGVALSWVATASINQWTHTLRATISGYPPVNNGRDFDYFKLNVIIENIVDDGNTVYV